MGRLVLGLDPGSRRTGYAILRSTQAGYFRETSGVWRLDADRPFPERLPDLRDRVLDLIGSYRPTEAALETCYVARSVRAALVLGHVRGVLLLLCLQEGLSVYEYSPGEIKRAVTGGGAAPKAQVGSMLRHLLLAPPARPPEDESDALAVAFCHMNRPALTRPRALLTAE
jgi:crossover junction endodeoxyribonuclease RuvC